MAKISKLALGLSAVVLAALAAGCGGGGGGGSSSVNSVPEASVSVTAPPAGNHRFTTAQWTQYKADAAAFKQINDATLARVSTCAKPTATASKPGVLQKCVGDSLTKLAAATKTLGADLAGYTNGAAGECATALGALINYVIPYEASIASLQNTIATANAGAVYSSVSSLKTARSGGQQANVAVAKACAPA
jgi:hypothetical protein